MRNACRHIFHLQKRLAFLLPHGTTKTSSHNQQPRRCIIRKFIKLKQGLLASLELNLIAVQEKAIAFGNLWLQMTTDHHPEICALNLERNVYSQMEGQYSIIKNHRNFNVRMCSELIQLRTAFFWIITQRVVVIPHRTNSLSLLQGPLKIGPKGCIEMRVRNYHYQLRNNTEERSSRPLRGGRLKSNLTQNRSYYRAFVLTDMKHRLSKEEGEECPDKLKL